MRRRSALEVLLAAVSQGASRPPASRRCAALGIDADIVDARRSRSRNALVHHAESRPGRAPAARHRAPGARISRSTSAASRTSAAGSSSAARMLTEAIVKGTQVPFEEARGVQARRRVGRAGLSRRLGSARAARDARLPAHRSSSDDAALARVLPHRRPPAGAVAISWISGSSARLPGLAAQLTEMLGIPVLLLQPHRVLLRSAARGRRKPSLGPQFAQAFGSVLRSAWQPSSTSTSVARPSLQEVVRTRRRRHGARHLGRVLPACSRMIAGSLRAQLPIARSSRRLLERQAAQHARRGRRRTPTGSSRAASCTRSSNLPAARGTGATG